MLDLLEKSKYDELKGFVARRSSVSELSMAAGTYDSLAANVEQLLAAAPKVGRGFVCMRCVLLPAVCCRRCGAASCVRHHAWQLLCYHALCAQPDTIADSINTRVAIESVAPDQTPHEQLVPCGPPPWAALCTSQDAKYGMDRHAPHLMKKMSDGLACTCTHAWGRACMASIDTIGAPCVDLIISVLTSQVDDMSSC